eukprot:scaffold258809_cov25-Tisochrysis_lutea.AAC.1
MELAQITEVRSGKAQQPRISFYRHAMYVGFALDLNASPPFDLNFSRWRMPTMSSGRRPPRPPSVNPGPGPLCQTSPVTHAF